MTPRYAAAASLTTRQISSASATSRVNNTSSAPDQVPEACDDGRREHQEPARAPDAGPRQAGEKGIQGGIAERGDGERPEGIQVRRARLVGRQHHYRRVPA